MHFGCADAGNAIATSFFQHDLDEIALNLPFLQRNETEASLEGDEAELLGQDGPRRTHGRFIESGRSRNWADKGGGPKTQEIQKEVIIRLDEMIKELTCSSGSNVGCLNGNDVGAIQLVIYGRRRTK